MKQAVCWLAARLSRLSLLVASGSDSVALVFWGRNPPRWAGLLVPVLRWGGLVGPRESATMVRAPAGLSRGVLGELRREFEPHTLERSRLLVRREAADFAALSRLLDGGS